MLSAVVAGYLLTLLQLKERSATKIDKIDKID